ncbi:MAG: VWA domain-containing protein [Nitrospiraceae bacterium]|nr:VWA domain-containing protein [Nitrospiraceae bacterium]
MNKAPASGISFVIMAVFIAALICCAPFAYSEGPQAKQPQPPQAAAQPVSQTAPAKPVDAGYDIVLLMDSSGSMKETDPQSYRKPAAQLFITLMNKGDRISIMSFGESTKTLLHLTEVTDKNQKSVDSAISAINSKELATNIYLAVKAGYEELARSDRANRIMLLMSDGKLALGSKEKDEEAHAALNALMPEIVKSGIKLYSMAFTNLSDMKFLEELARSGGGFSKIAKEDKDIHLIFTDLFEKIKSPDTVPIEGDTFKIDSNIAEAIVIVNKQPGASTALYDPSGKQHTGSAHSANMKWHTSSVFDMISIQSPAGGDWKIKLSKAEGNKVFVITNLKLMSSFNYNYVNVGSVVSVDAWLQKDDIRIGSKGALGQTYFYCLVTMPDGSRTRVDLKLPEPAQGKSEVDDVVRKANIKIPAKGEYALKIIAEGPAFKREKVYSFKAVEPPTVAVKAPVVEKRKIVRVVFPSDILMLAGLFAGINAAGAALWFGSRLFRKKI